jgi:hypothetical protein
MTMLPSISEIALSGHSLSQAPQLMQVSISILYAMRYPSFGNSNDDSNFTIVNALREEYHNWIKQVNKFMINIVIESGRKMSRFTNGKLSPEQPAV